MKLPGWAKHLKKKWNVDSDVDFFLIMTVFSLAGMSISFVRKPIFHLLGITAATPFWIKTLVYIPLIPPVYQMNLLIYGFLLGQFGFFWNWEKRLGRMILKSFTARKQSNTQKI